MSKPSDSAGFVVPAEVRELIEESRTIQGWMDRLSSHAGAARPEVFERVRADYQGRLDGVNGKLARHRADLEGRLDARRSEVESLRSDRDSHQAELEEARLRHAVGEFSDSRWEDRRGSIEESLGELDALLEVEEGAVAELSGIIESIGEGGTPVPGVAVMAEPEIVVEGLEVEIESGLGTEEEVDERDEADEGPEPEVEAAAEAEVAGGPDALAEESEEEDSDASELEEEDEPAVASAERPARAHLVDAGDEDEEAGGEYVDELEFLESLSLDEADRFDAVSAMLDEEEQPPEA